MLVHHRTLIWFLGARLNNRPLLFFRLVRSRVERDVFSKQRFDLLVNFVGELLAASASYLDSGRELEIEAVRYVVHDFHDSFLFVRNHRFTALSKQQIKGNK